MKIFLLIIFLVGLSSCTGSNADQKEYTENPCQDVLYQKLKKMKVSEMTGSEREYYNLKDKECADFSSQQKEKHSDKKSAEKNLLFILYGAGLLVAAGLFLTLAFKGWH